jgi:autotransporter-associated beta strand protein
MRPEPHKPHSSSLFAWSIAASLVVAAAFSPLSSSAQVTVGLNFVGGKANTSVSSMDAGETAGVISQSNWNNLTNESGGDSTLVNNSGATVSGLSVSYTSLNTWADSAISDSAGNNRLMRGYLDFNVNSGSATVTVSGVASPVYDVIVYTNGDEDARVGHFQIGAQSYWVKDDSTFSGSFIQGTGTADPGSHANAQSGNYMVFSGLTSSSFTLSAIGEYTIDGTLRAPVNAIQIVQPTTTLFWDRNGSSTGAGTTPGGNWATSGSNRSNWTSSSAGTSTPGNWTNGAVAVFSAGSDATGTYNVNVASSSIQTGAIYVQEGNVTFSTTGSGSIRMSDSTPDIIVAGGASATVNVRLENNIISATAIGLQKQGTGTLTLGSTANNYGGKTVITEGTLRLGTSGVIPNGSALTVASGATFDLNNQTETIGSLAGAGTVALGTGTLIAGGDNTSTFFSGAITGSGIFEKTGSGTFTLGIDLSYNGTMRLDSGTLALNGFDLSLNTLHITGDSILDFGMNGASLLTAGSLLIDAGVTLTINNWTDTIDYFYALNSPGGTQGSAPLNQIIFAGFSANDTKWQSYDKQITPVPEPSTYGALLMAGACGVWFWRRRSLSRAESE